MRAMNRLSRTDRDWQRGHGNKKTRTAFPEDRHREPHSQPEARLCRAVPQYGQKLFRIRVAMRFSANNKTSGHNSGRTTCPVTKPARLEYGTLPAALREIAPTPRPRLLNGRACQLRIACRVERIEHHTEASLRYLGRRIRLPKPRHWGVTIKTPSRLDKLR